MQILILLILLISSRLEAHQFQLCQQMAKNHFMMTCTEGPNSPSQSITHMRGEKVHCKKAHSCLGGETKSKNGGCSF